MESHAKITITAGALAHLRDNTPQREALVDNVIGPDRWMTCPTAEVWFDALDESIMVKVGGMTIGIEKDGYTHS